MNAGPFEAALQRAYHRGRERANVGCTRPRNPYKTPALAEAFSRGHAEALGINEARSNARLWSSGQ